MEAKGAAYQTNLSNLKLYSRCRELLNVAVISENITRPKA